MENMVIELIEPVQLEKQGCIPVIFNAGTLFRVVLESKLSYLVKADSGFTFVVPLAQENKVWKKFTC